LITHDSHNLGSSELSDNVILLFQPPASPEVNPTERVWEYLKDFLGGSVFSNLDELRTKVQEILASFTDRVIGFLTGWSWILHSLFRNCSTRGKKGAINRESLLNGLISS
jgi:transposase